MSPVCKIPLDESLFFVSLVIAGMICPTLFLAQFIGNRNLCYQYTDYLDQHHTPPYNNTPESNINKVSRMKEMITSYKSS